MPPPDSAPPPLIRPIPRRPFSLNLTGATPPDDESPPRTPPPPSGAPQLLDPRQPSSATFPPESSGSASISRAQSIMNLTASTLFGIYSPTMTASVSGAGRSYSNYGYAYGDRDEPPGTPWGTGAESPGYRGAGGLDARERGPGGDEEDEEDGDRAAALAQLRERLGSSRRTRPRAVSAPKATRPAPASLWSLVTRAVLLFVLGVAYGGVVSRLRDEGGLGPFHADAGAPAGVAFDRRYVAFWGISGVVLGSLLPWFDLVWDQMLGGSRSSSPVAVVSAASPAGVPSGAGGKVGLTPDTDWALVIRGAGAFAGIVFAIRKLPWDSTMQASVALALVNPFLWYLIDRSKSGFLLASAVGLFGSALIMSLNPDMMPGPSSPSFGSARYNGSEPAFPHARAQPATVETGIWMLSVLFCSCVCFGNIGRRLALNTSASARGRWGGIR